VSGESLYSRFSTELGGADGIGERRKLGGGEARHRSARSFSSALPDRHASPFHTPNGLASATGTDHGHCRPSVPPCHDAGSVPALQPGDDVGRPRGKRVLPLSSVWQEPHPRDRFLRAIGTASLHRASHSHPALMTNALTHARRTTRAVKASTLTLGRTLLHTAVRYLSRAARSHADWSARAWSAHSGTGAP